MYGWTEFVDTRVGTFGLRISYAEPEVVPAVRGIARVVLPPAPRVRAIAHVDG